MKKPRSRAEVFVSFCYQQLAWTEKSRSVIHRSMEEDLDEVISRTKHYHFNEKEGVRLLNRISQLPASKKDLKRSIIERIRYLIGVYISLATFVSDEEVDFLICEYGTRNRKALSRIRKIYTSVYSQTELLNKEVRREIKKL